MDGQLPLSANSTLMGLRSERLNCACFFIHVSQLGCEALELYRAVQAPCPPPPRRHCCWMDVLTVSAGGGGEAGLLLLPCLASLSIISSAALASCGLPGQLLLHQVSAQVPSPPRGLPSHSFLFFMTFDIWCNSMFMCYLFYCLSLLSPELGIE